jgi:saccharopine dehydrogenase-like NADP-dependent oxidoreductase
VSVKVLVIGGAGKQGSHAAVMLAGKPEISELVLADANEDALARAAAAVGDKASTVVIDVADTEAVADLLGAEPKPHVVLNCVGPGLRFAAPIGRAAIDAGVHYVDLQDDAEAVGQVETLRDAAADARVTLISGAGLTPGLSNLLVRRAHDAFDTLDEVRIFWVANMTERPTVANWGHRLGLWTSDVPVVEDGAVKYVPGGTSEVIVEWPAPAGSVVERLCAHPEPLTLNRRFPDVRSISVRGGYTPGEHDELIADLRKLGLTSLTAVDVAGAELSAVDFLSSFAQTDAFRGTPRFQRILEREREIGDNNGLRVEATGTRAGRKERIVSAFFSSDRNLGIYMTAAVTTYLLVRGSIDEPGLFFLEDLAPEPILEQLESEGVTVTHAVEPE